MQSFLYYHFTLYQSHCNFFYREYLRKMIDVFDFWHWSRHPATLETTTTTTKIWNCSFVFLRLFTWFYWLMGNFYQLIILGTIIFFIVLENEMVDVTSVRCWMFRFWVYVSVNIFALRWLNPILSLAIGFKPLGLSHWKVLFAECLMTADMSFLKSARLSEFLILESKLFHSTTA